MIGILAYGSLIANPGREIENAIATRIPDVQTPFPVEYARKSSSRAGAPTLVPVPDGCGQPVNAVILVLRDGITNQQAMDMLYRRELHKEEDMETTYDDPAQRDKNDALVIESIQGENDLSVVYYTVLRANFAEILETNRTPEAKAQLLAQAAIDSLTADTYTKGLDGIQYLADNMAAGVVTALTEAYAQAILKEAGNADNLDQARQFIAQEKGIIE